MSTTFKHLRGCKWDGLRCPNEVHGHGCTPDVGCDWCRCACRTVSIDRAVLAEAAEMIEELMRVDVNERKTCWECCAPASLGGDDVVHKSPIVCDHAPGCGYIRVSDALKKALEESNG